MNGVLKVDTAAKIESIRRDRAAGKTYAQIAVAFGCTMGAVQKFAWKYLPEEERTKKGWTYPQVRKTNGDVVDPFPPTQRRYRIEEWQAAMGGYSKCRYCKDEAHEAAHIVEDSKRNLAKYGFYAIYHRDNLIPTCRKHNSKAMNEARGPAGEEEHMNRIITALREHGVDPHKGRHV